MDPSVRRHASEPTAAPDWKGTERYEVVRCLGRGGMGAVYEAWDREAAQSVALKTVLHFTPATLYHFKQEFRTLADVSHPNLVRLHELVMSGADRIFFAMELVRGPDFLTYVCPPGLVPSSEPPRAGGDSDLSETRRERRGEKGAGTRPSADAAGESNSRGAKRTRKESPADLARLRPALRQLVEGLLALHGSGKLHRDIKPTNILVTNEGRVVILDFGVATEIARVVDENLSETSEIVGTIKYMAPEQAVAEDPTPASDWYSVGVVLYEALVGRPPFTGSEVDVLATKTLNDPLPPAACVDGVPPDLDALCVALLHREPAMRPHASEILKRLGAASSTVVATAPAPSLAEIENHHH